MRAQALPPESRGNKAAVRGAIVPRVFTQQLRENRGGRATRKKPHNLGRFSRGGFFVFSDLLLG